MHLGRLSYPLYLMHFAVLRALTHAMPSLPPLAAMSLGTLFACGLSLLLLQVYDEPLRAWLSAAFLSPRGPRERSLATPAA